MCNDRASRKVLYRSFLQRAGRCLSVAGLVQVQLAYALIQIILVKRLFANAMSSPLQEGPVERVCMNDLYLHTEKESICTSEECPRLSYHWPRPRSLPPTKLLGGCAGSPTTTPSLLSFGKCIQGCSHSCNSKHPRTPAGKGVVRVQ